MSEGKPNGHARSFSDIHKAAVFMEKSELLNQAVDTSIEAEECAAGQPFTPGYQSPQYPYGAQPPAVPPQVPQGSSNGFWSGLKANAPWIVCLVMFIFYGYDRVTSRAVSDATLQTTVNELKTTVDKLVASGGTYSGQLKIDLTVNGAKVSVKDASQRRTGYDPQHSGRVDPFIPQSFANDVNIPATAHPVVKD